MNKIIRLCFSVALVASSVVSAAEAYDKAFNMLVLLNQ
jgi:hypothetical protein